jgi:hypothetical protein
MDDLEDSLFADDQTYFLALLGAGDPAAQRVATRLALLKQAERKQPDLPAVNKMRRNPPEPAAYVARNMRSTVLRSFRATQRLRKVAEEASQERGRQLIAKSNRSKVETNGDKVINEEFIQLRMKQLRSYVLTTNAVPVFLHREVFRANLWLLHVLSGNFCTLLFARLQRTKKIRQRLVFPGIVQTFWRIRKSRKDSIRKERCRVILYASIRIMLFLLVIYRRVQKRRWGVTVLVSVLKAKKQEYATKMHMKRLAVALHIQRWWRGKVAMKHWRINLMVNKVLEVSPVVNRTLCTHVCSIQYVKWKRKCWRLNKEQCLAIIDLCKRMVDTIASDLAMISIT